MSLGAKRRILNFALCFAYDACSVISYMFSSKSSLALINNSNSIVLWSQLTPYLSFARYIIAANAVSQAGIVSRFTAHENFNTLIATFCQGPCVAAASDGVFLAFWMTRILSLSSIFTIYFLKLLLKPTATN